MNLKDQLIHDICVLEERITRCYDDVTPRLEEIEKLKKRQRKAVDTYLDEVRPEIRATEGLLKWAEKNGAAYDGKNTNFAELDEEGKGFSPRRVDPQPELCTSDGWHKDLNPHIIILDPDGWDRKNYQYSFFEERVTRKVYEYRLGMSTIVRKTLEP